MNYDERELAKNKQEWEYGLKMTKIICYAVVACVAMTAACSMLGGGTF